jgi:hypothetical protein
MKRELIQALSQFVFVPTFTIKDGPEIRKTKENLALLRSSSAIKRAMIDEGLNFVDFQKSLSNLFESKDKVDNY